MSDEILKWWRQELIAVCEGETAERIEEMDDKEFEEFLERVLIELEAELPSIVENALEEMEEEEEWEEEEGVW